MFKVVYSSFNERAASLVEFSVLVACISLLALGGVAGFGKKIRTSMCKGYGLITSSEIAEGELIEGMERNQNQCRFYFRNSVGAAELGRYFYF